MPSVRPLVLAICAIMFLPLAGCSYHFQQDHNPLVDLGIHKIYVTGFTNRTYRPGIEHYFTNAMVREIGRSKSFKLVNSQEGADAVLSGEVATAEEATSVATTLNVGSRSPGITTEYSSRVSCVVRLVDRHGRQIFSQTVNDDKVHPGAGQKGDAGSTAPLINDSEQRLAIQFLADQMMASVYQRMIDTF